MSFENRIQLSFYAIWCAFGSIEIASCCWCCCCCWCHSGYYCCCCCISLTVASSHVWKCTERILHVDIAIIFKVTSRSKYVMRSDAESQWASYWTSDWQRAWCVWAICCYLKRKMISGNLSTKRSSFARFGIESNECESARLCIKSDSKAFIVSEKIK